MLLLSSLQRTLLSTGVLFLLFGFVCTVEAATLGIGPSTGVYSSGQTFSVSVVVNTQGQKINAAEGTVSFNPSQLSVVSVSKGSLFNLWTAEPAFSNTQGTVTFSGGTPTGYTGSSGTVITITFRAVGSGSARVSLRDGSVLAADGRGTNILSSLLTGNYTISSQTTVPEPERIIEYVPPANTPSAPAVNSSSHPDSSSWYREKTLTVSWAVPPGVTGVRTLLNSSPSSVPTQVYDSPISTLSIPDIDEGTSYFHIQFRNAEGWGRVAHYQVNIDSVAPTDFVLTLPEEADLSAPEQVLTYTLTEAESSVRRFLLQIDGAEAIPYEIADDEAGTIKLPALAPGYHTIIVEAFDEAGNSTIASLSLTILAFDKPIFTEFPERASPNAIPVFKGTTRPNASVEVTITPVGRGEAGSSNTQVYQAVSDETGAFTIIPDSRLPVGVYEVIAVATDEYGAQSSPSDTRRLMVEEAGYVRLGSYAISLLSVVVPLLALAGLLVFMLVFIANRSRLFRIGVARESAEALSILQREFSNLHQQLYDDEQHIISERKSGKLTKSESDLLEHMKAALLASEHKVKKEIKDVKDLSE